MKTNRKKIMSLLMAAALLWAISVVAVPLVSASDLPGYSNLNSDEKPLFWANPWIGYKVYGCAKDATHETEGRFGRIRNNDESNAFRHAYWNALMVKRVGYSWAYKWATAHETGAKGQPALEKEMDLFNNREGRFIGNKYSKKSDQVLSNKVYDAVKKGKLKEIKNNKLVPTKI
jgi:hypothetical protein